MMNKTSTATEIRHPYPLTWFVLADLPGGDRKARILDLRRQLFHNIPSIYR